MDGSSPDATGRRENLWPDDKPAIHHLASFRAGEVRPNAGPAT